MPLLSFIAKHNFFERGKTVDFISSIVPHSSVFFGLAGRFSIRLKVGIEQANQARLQACPLRHGTAPALFLVFPKRLGFQGRTTKDEDLTFEHLATKLEISWKGI